MRWTFEGRQIGVKMTESLVRKPRTMVDFHMVREREKEFRKAGIGWTCYRQTSPSREKAYLGKVY